MKTVDEVIKACDDFLDNGMPCADCHIESYCDNNDCFMYDALHCLREYQTMKYGYIKAMADLEDNPPLTWDELKKMEGKPVWVEERAENGLWWTYWVIWDGENAVLPEEKYGTDWQAYRKER